jgi:hypothetical protein
MRIAAALGRGLAGSITASSASTLASTARGAIDSNTAVTTSPASEKGIGSGSYDGTDARGPAIVAGAIGGTTHVADAVSTMVRRCRAPASVLRTGGLLRTEPPSWTALSDQFMGEAFCRCYSRSSVADRHREAALREWCTDVLYVLVDQS